MASILPSRLTPRLINLLGRLRHPKRLVSYILLKAAFAGKWSTVPVLPVKMDIEPINSCNFRCDHCQVTHWDKAKAQLDVDQFKQILDQFPNLVEVKLQGMGEPLLNKQFVQLLKEGEGRGLAMRFHSNGSACTPANADRLLELNNTSIVFSIDGACAETFEKMRPGSNFDRILSNLRYLTGKRSAKGPSPKIFAWTVVTKDNIREIPDIVRLCGSLGLDRVTLQPYLTTWGKDDMSDHVTSLKVDALDEAYSTLLHQAHEAARGVGIDLDMMGNSVYSTKNKCPWAWESSYIAANGDVVPCCIVADADVAKMGNVFERPFAEIWNGPAYQDLRKKLRSDDLPDYCKACYSDAKA